MAQIDNIKQNRLDKLETIKKLGLNPFPSKSRKNHCIIQALDNFSKLSKSQKKVILGGRIMSIRGHGGATFLDVRDGTGKIQAFLNKDKVKEKNYNFFLENFDIGDIIELEGILFQTKRGEKTIEVSKFNILAKSLLPMPEKWHGLQDYEDRYRKRYLDILLNEDLREIFVKKAKFWQVTRDFMNKNGFFEVETPTLEVTTGGAEANPFKTHHDDLDINLYLRISVGELWQKRLIAAGFEKTFEIGRIYRNEGSGPNHLQEFTNMEFYWAYADYEDGMELSKKLFMEIAHKVFNTTKFKSRGFEFDLAKEWKKVGYREEILSQTEIDVLNCSEKDIRSKLKELNINPEAETFPRLVDCLWKYCRKNIAGPIFLINHPKFVSPLAKEKADNPQLTERFQIIIAGTELGNGYSELNNPIEQKERFKQQQKLLKAGDKEAMMPDWDFVEMLEHGMPPTCGFGFPERLFSVLIDKPMRETTLFPLIKPEEKSIN